MVLLVGLAVQQSPPEAEHAVRRDRGAEPAEHSGDEGDHGRRRAPTEPLRDAGEPHGHSGSAGGSSGGVAHALDGLKVLDLWGDHCVECRREGGH